MASKNCHLVLCIYVSMTLTLFVTFSDKFVMSQIDFLANIYKHLFYLNFKFKKFAALSLSAIKINIKII